MSKKRLKALPKRLPKFLHPYFWEVDAFSLDPTKYPEYVAERAMNWGDLKVLKWLKEHFPEDFLIKIARNSKQLFKKNKIFWLNYLDILPKKILCSQKELLQKPNTVWPY